MVVIEACTCNFGIPGVEELPAHSHRTHGSEFIRLNSDWVGRNGETAEQAAARLWPLDGEITIWVSWKRVARELSCA